MRITQSIDLASLASKLVSIEHLRVDSILADGVIIDTDVSRILEIRAAYTFTGTNDGSGHNIWTDATGRKLLVDSDIVVAAHSATATLSFSGMIEEGASISASTSSLADQDGSPSIVSYTWEVSSNGSDWSVAPGIANTANYAIASDQSLVGKYLRFSITTNDGTILRSSGSLVANFNDVATGTLSILGILEEGGSISASVTDLDDEDGTPSVAAYKWEVSSNGSTNWSVAPGVANSANYAIPSDQSLVGKYLRFSITTNDGGTLSSNGSLVANVNDAATATLSISGSIEEGGSVSASVTSLSDADGTPLISSYAWEIADSINGTYDAISSVTSANYTIPLDQSLVGKYLRFSITTNDGTILNSSGSLVANVNDAATAFLSISGTTQEGGSISASVTDLDDEDGTPSIASYTWEVSSNGSDWTAAPGSTNTANYFIPSDQSLAEMYLRFSISTNDATILKSAGAKINNINDAPSLFISGTAKVGLTLSATLTDNDGLPRSLTYTWLNQDHVILGNATTYVVQPGDLGKTISVAVSYTDLQGHSESLSSAATDAVAHVSFTEVHHGKMSNEVLVNTYTVGDQWSPTVTDLSDGGWLVSWQSLGQDGSGYGIYQQRYDATGVKMSGEVLVNTYTYIDQNYPTVASLKDGGWLVSWTSSDQDGSYTGVYQQRFDANGMKVSGEALVNTYTNSVQFYSAVTGLNDGGWLVTWHSWGQDGSDSGIYQQRYDASGAKVSGEVLVNTYTTTQQKYAAVTNLSDGGWLVSWVSSDQDGSYDGIYQQRYDATGMRVAEENLVNAFTRDNQWFPAVTGLHDGGWLVSWQSADHDSWGWGIYQQRYDATGRKVSGEILVNTFTRGDQTSPTVTSLSDGGWLVSWTSTGQEASGAGVYQQRYDANGMSVSGEVLVNSFTNSVQAASSVTGLSDGSWLVAWESHAQDGFGWGIYQQRFGLVKTPVGNYMPELVDSAASDNLGSLIGQWIPSEGNWTFSGSTLGRYGELFVNPDGSYVYIPDSAKINLLPTGTFTESLTIGASISALNESFNLVIQLQGADDQETRVNTYTSSNQEFPTVTNLSDGGWLVSWQSFGQDGSGCGIYQQRYNAAGDKVSGEVLVNSFTSDAQISPTVTALSDGGWLVSWQSWGNDGSAYGIYQQRYDAAGLKVFGEVLVNTYTGSNQQYPTVTALKDGGWLVSWQSWLQDGSDDGIYQQRYDAAGAKVSGEVLVNTYKSNSQSSPMVIGLSDGGWLVAWQSYGQDGSSDGIYQQRYDAAGIKMSGEVLVNTYKSSSQSAPTMTSLSDGGWLVAWHSSGQDGFGSGIYYGNGIYQQRYDAAGIKVSGEVLVNTYTQESQSSPAVTGLSDGGWLVSWHSWGQDGSDSGIYQQRYDASGSKVSNEVLVNTKTSESQSSPAVTDLSDGGWLVSWHSSGQDGSGSGIFQARFAADGSRISRSEQSGIAAPETLTGSANSNDLITDISTGDTALGLAGDDSFVLASNDFALIDGGGGKDSLTLSSNLDLSALDNAKLKSIEVINLNGKTLALDLSEVLNLASSLTLKGSGTLDLLDTWSQGLTANGFTTFTQGAATLLVDTHINVV